MSAKPEDRPFFRRLFRSLTSPSAPRTSRDDRAARALASMCRALLSERGEVSGVRLATDAVGAYQTLEPGARDGFFAILAGEFSERPDAIALAADAYVAEPSHASLRRLQAAVESPRQELFRRLNLAPTGTRTLVQMRQDLLRTLDDHPEREGVDADLVHLFKSWFNGGFLLMRRIDWRTSALILERLIQYEAVHQIQGWRDLRRRLESDRRCYALFHLAMPDEPLIFIEVALTRRLSAKVQPLIDPESVVVDPATARCATFYSITNCQDGLRGISFGNYLIKQVVEDLGRAFPKLRLFATLSPIPGFRKWLSAQREPAEGGRMARTVAALLARLEPLESVTERTTPAELREDLVALCAYYLLHAKHGRAPLDPVARFHLANGASLQRLNWLGDTSDAGMRRSFGLMANYVYRLVDLEQNHEAYARDYRVVASRQFERLSKATDVV